MGRVQYDSLCAKGRRIDLQAKELAKRLPKVARILMNAEEDYPEQVARYRAELLNIKQQRNTTDIKLQRHVAHCTDGCLRASGGPLAFADEAQVGVFDRAPSHAKPDLPRAEDMAAMIRDGQTVQALAHIYQRHEQTLRRRLTDCGFSSVTGKPLDRPHLRVVRSERDPEWPPLWMADGLCAQTDPEAFFPERGGTPRDAKVVCAGCPVKTECLDYAVENRERFGVWGGLSERERRAIIRRREDGAA